MAKGGRGGKRTGVAERPLSKDQLDALDYYTQDGYYINNMLRNGYDLDDSEKEFIRLLDEATNSTVKQDVLYRIVDASTIFGDGVDDFEYDNLKSHIVFGDDAYDRGAYSQGIKARMEKLVQSAIGKTHTDKGYMSTTFDEETASHKQSSETHGRNRVVMRITNAKGAKGRDISKQFNREWDAENEVLLARNNSYQVKRIYNKDYMIYVDVELKK